MTSTVAAIDPTLAVSIGMLGANIAMIIVNAVTAHKLHKATHANDLQKIELARDEIVFRRQLEAMDAISTIIAAPINISARLVWIGGSLSTTADINIEQINDHYIEVASKHFYPLGKAMVQTIDDLHARAWELLAEILVCRTDREFESRREALLDHRIACIEAGEGFMKQRVNLPVESEGEAAVERYTIAMKKIQLALRGIKRIRLS